MTVLTFPARPEPSRTYPGKVLLRCTRPHPRLSGPCDGILLAGVPIADYEERVAGQVMHCPKCERDTVFD